MSEEPKKDLTSIIDLSKIELAKAAENPSAAGTDFIQEIPIEKISEFGTLDELALSSPELIPTPEEQTNTAAEVSTSSISNTPEPVQTVTEIETKTEQTSNTEHAPEEPVVTFDHPEHQSNAGPDENSQEPQIHVDTSSPSTIEAHSAPEMHEPSLMVEAPSTIELPETDHSRADTTVREPEPEPDFEPQQTTQQYEQREPVVAPPAGHSSLKKSSSQPSQKNSDMAEIRAFAEKLAIGKPKLMAQPAFSLLAMAENRKFTAAQMKAIEQALTSEDYGVRFEEIKIQLQAGKLFIPQISEFAAITLAQKIRESVGNIEIDLANEIFKSKSGGPNTSTESEFLINAEHFEPYREEIKDLAAEPESKDQVFTVTTPELSDFVVTRILGMVTTSEIIMADVAENPDSHEFETVTDRLSKELQLRGFKLGAHGVLGVNFSLLAIESSREQLAKLKRAYRIIATGTAVRGRRNHPTSSK